MAQFDVYLNPNKASRNRIPYLVDLQSNLLEGMNNIVIAPLRRRDSDTGIPTLRLNPVVTVEDVPCFVRVQELAAIPRRSLGQPVGNLAQERDALLAALDLLFTGF